MITCRTVSDLGDTIAFLRRNVFSNNCILDALEHNIPPVPRQVYIAECEDAICGVMSVEDCGDWTVADLRAAGGTPSAMLRSPSTRRKPSQLQVFLSRSQCSRHGW